MAFCWQFRERVESIAPKGWTSGQVESLCKEPATGGFFVQWSIPAPSAVHQEMLSHRSAKARCLTLIRLDVSLLSLEWAAKSEIHRFVPAAAKQESWAELKQPSANIDLQNHNLSIEEAHLSIGILSAVCWWCTWHEHSSGWTSCHTPSLQWVKISYSWVFCSSDENFRGQTQLFTPSRLAKTHHGYHGCSALLAGHGCPLVPNCLGGSAASTDNGHHSAAGRWRSQGGGPLWSRREESVTRHGHWHMLKRRVSDGGSQVVKISTQFRRWLSNSTRSDFLFQSQMSREIEVRFSRLAPGLNWVTWLFHKSMIISRLIQFDLVQPICCHRAIEDRVGEGHWLAGARHSLPLSAGYASGRLRAGRQVRLERLCTTATACSLRIHRNFVFVVPNGSVCCQILEVVWGLHCG